MGEAATHARRKRPQRLVGNGEAKALRKGQAAWRARFDWADPGDRK